MADLTTLKEVGEELVPLVKDLVKLAGKGEDVGEQDRTRSNAAVVKLRQVVAAADVPTVAGLAERSAAIHAARRSVMTLLIEAATNPNVALKRTQSRILEAQATALRSAHGRLLEMAVFDDIARLLTAHQIATIDQQLSGAAAEIAQRQKAREIIDAIIAVAVSAGKIAAKLA